jgi:predicted outer membrane repeat protein
VLNITGSKVTGNKVTGADEWGAGINAESDTTVNITNTYVTGNTTTASLGNGAGIASDDAAAVNVVGSFVSGNTSQAGEGGGIFARGPGSLSVTSSTISNNSADDSGGGIASSAAVVHVLKSNILGNHAGGGGGIYATPSSSGFGLLSIGSTTFDHNQASQTGGGVLADGGCGAGFLSIVVQTATFSNNSTTTPLAGGGGFAQRAACGSRINTSMTDTLFNANTASGAAGGALYSLTDDFPSSSSITLQQGSQPKQMMMLQNNQAAFGAGIYNSGSGSGLTLRFGAKIQHNRATVNGGGVFQNCGAFLNMLPGAMNAFNTPNNLGSGPCV